MKLRNLFVFGPTVLLMGCHSNPSITPPLEPANRVVEKTVTIPPPDLAMHYHLQDGNNPALDKAYQQYIKTGEAKTIETDQFVQFPYNAGSQPLISASVMELTVISLEPGEQVGSVSSGDPSRWSYSLAYSGNKDSRQAHVLIKPSKPNIGTDFFITTDRRAYLLKLVASNNGKYVRDVRFWYPETLQPGWQRYNEQKQTESAKNPVVAEFPNLDITQLNFNYKLAPTAPIPTWIPKQIFDDGVHTYIQFPSNIIAEDLPVLFIQNEDIQEMVNYRVKTPYFVVDKVFQKAVLISGSGRKQQRVTLIRA